MFLSPQTTTHLKSLHDKIALVTGAASGLGRAIAMKFASEGAKVIVSDIDETGGMEAVAWIEKKGGLALFIPSDASLADHQQALVERVLQECGGLHIACNNAGIGGALAPTGEYPTADWDRLIALNLSGVFYGMRYQIPAILQSGGGAIVNIASIMGQTATRLSPAYVASKHGVVGLTKAAALEYAQQGIRINCVGPAYLNTPLLVKTLDESQVNKVVKLHPMGRLGEAEEVAELVLWLSSDKASFATGGYYPIDGGYLAQ